ncbi:MAG: diguanylate cyclase [Capsulimonadaceae bacterium]|nr:diguanylate cyclase [Capsulimonadaceae bacterium]
MRIKHSNQSLMAAGFAAVAALLLIEGLSEVWTVRTHAEVRRSFDRYELICNKADQLESAFSALVADERGYLITSNQAFSARFAVEGRQIRSQLGDLVKLASVSPSLQGRSYAVIPESEDLLHQLDSDVAAKQLQLYDPRASAPSEADIQKQLIGITAALESIESESRTILHTSRETHRLYQTVSNTCRWLLSLIALLILANVWMRVKENDRLSRKAIASERGERRKFETLFERSSEAYLVYGDNGIIDCNIAAARILGYHTSQELIGVSIKSLLVSSGAAEPMFDVPSRSGMDMARGSHKFECACRTRNGRDFPVRMSLTRIKIAGEPVIMAAILDLSESKRAEAAIKADRERYARISSFQDAINASGLDIHKAMEIVGDATMVMLGAEGAHVSLIEGETEQVEVAAGIVEDLRGRALQLEDTSAGKCLDDRQTLLCCDCETDERFNTEIIRAYGVRSLLAIPLFVGDQPVALVKAVSNRLNAFAEDDIRAFSLLANMLGRTISRTRDYEAIQELMRERTAAVEALRASEAQLLEAQNLTRSGSWTIDISTGDATWSRELYRILGLANDTDGLTLDRVIDHFIPQDAVRLRAAHAECLKSGAGYDFDLRLLTPAGDLRHVHVIGRAERDPSGPATRLFGTVVDITYRKQVEQALRESQERYRILFDDNPQPMWVIDVETQSFLEVNASALQHYGYTRAEFLSMKACDLLVDAEAPGRDSQLYLDHIGSGERYWGIARHKRRNGSEIDVEILSNPTTFLSGRSGRLMLAQDVTARLSAESQIQAYTVALEFQKRELQKANLELEALATTDGLTGVKNHRAFQERFAHEFKRSVRYKTDVCMMMIDVDLFKTFNDEFGHPAGDEVLRTVSTILCSHARETDFVARYGGEEFAVILPNTHIDDAVLIAERMKKAIENADWPDRKITASFGVCNLRSGARSAAEMISFADQALYQAKLDGRNRVNVSHTIQSSRAA